MVDEIIFVLEESLVLRSHAEKIDEEETRICQLEDFVKSSGSKVVHLRVWAKEAKKKKEEEWMFLKQRSYYPKL